LDEALVSWGSAYALEPENMEALFALDSHLQAKIETSSPDDVLSLITLAKSLADLGQKEGAYRLLVKATDLAPENEEAWVWRAGVTDDIGDTMLSLNQVLALNPDNAQAQAGLHWARARVGKPEKEATPDLAPADKLVADGIALIADDKRRAHDLFVQATELDPKNENAWLWRGSTTHDLDEANTCIDQALTVNPNNEAAQEARTWLRERRLGDAVKPSSPLTAFPSAPGASELPSPSAHPDRMALLLAVLLGLLVLAIAAFLLMRLVTAR
jgi:tetratricopeptide (TPR) repeat protein